MANINVERAAYIYGASFDSEIAILKNLFFKSNITYTEGGSKKTHPPHRSGVEDGCQFL